jgi:hypothetical protein
MAGTSASLSGLLARFELGCANAIGRAILVVGNVLRGEGQDCKRTTQHFGVVFCCCAMIRVAFFGGFVFWIENPLWN